MIIEELRHLLLGAARREWLAADFGERLRMLDQAGLNDLSLDEVAEAVTAFMEELPPGVSLLLSSAPIEQESSRPRSGDSGSREDATGYVAESPNRQLEEMLDRLIRRAAGVLSDIADDEGQVLDLDRLHSSHTVTKQSR